jgi:transcriptional regulator with XRE-family HTH domain
MTTSPTGRRGLTLDNESLAERVREEIARRHLSRQALAADAKISLSTLEKALSGRRPFTLASIVRLEEVLGVSLRPKTNGAAGTNGSGTAPDELGNYGRAAVNWLEGAFLTLRPSLGERGAIYAYRTDVTWDETTARLTFTEKERTDSDFSQFGSVSVPQQSGHIYFVTNRHGQYRLILVARPVITGEMHGIITTLQAGRGSHLSPVSMPIVFQPIRDGVPPHFGRIARGHSAYPRYSALLRKTVADDFATLLDL